MSYIYIKLTISYNHWLNVYFVILETIQVHHRSCDILLVTSYPLKIFGTVSSNNTITVQDCSKSKVYALHSSTYQTSYPLFLCSGHARGLKVLDGEHLEFCSDTFNQIYNDPEVVYIVVCCVLLIASTI